MTDTSTGPDGAVAPATAVAFVRAHGTALFAATDPLDAVSVPLAEGDDPERAVRDRLDELGVEAELVRVGRPVAVDGRTLHPFLFETADRTATDGQWAPPTVALDRPSVPGLWRAYRRVAPSVRSITADDAAGAAELSVRALEVLRDRAAVVAREGGSRAELADLARRLRTARPGMAPVGNRVDRAMATARTPAELERVAVAGIARAHRVDEAAAREATARLTDRTVLTLSRSGTVLRALSLADPRAVFVAESRPAREGVAVAERLAERTAVTLHTDAAVGTVLATRSVDAVVVGADALDADRLVNKTGTRTAAVVAAHEDVPVYAVAATDKVATGPVTLATGTGEAVYDGPAPVEVADPTFDETPLDLLAGVITERGVLDGEGVAAVATELRALADWEKRWSEGDCSDGEDGEPTDREPADGDRDDRP